MARTEEVLVAELNPPSGPPDPVEEPPDLGPYTRREGISPDDVRQVSDEEAAYAPPSEEDEA